MLRIGLIPERNIFSQKQRYEPIAEYLSERIHAHVELVVLSRYGNIIENFVSNGLDGAFFGSFTGALAQRKLSVEAIARPEYPDGTSTYHGLLFVRKDSGISSVEDMKGKRFAFVDKATTAGWLLPLYYFKTHGVDDPRITSYNVCYTKLLRLSIMTTFAGSISGWSASIVSRIVRVTTTVLSASSR